MQTTGIDLQNVRGVHEIQRFQDHFSEYKIVVCGELDCTGIIFEGQVISEQRVNLLYGDVTRHFHVIAYLTGAMVKRYDCEGCNKSSRSGATHKCRETCTDCMSIGPCIFTTFESCAWPAIERLEVKHDSTSTRQINRRERLYVRKRGTVQSETVS